MDEKIVELLIALGWVEHFRKLEKGCECSILGCEPPWNLPLQHYENCEEIVDTFIASQFSYAEEGHEINEEGNAAAYYDEHPNGIYIKREFESYENFKRREKEILLRNAEEYAKDPQTYMAQAGCQLIIG